MTFVDTPTPVDVPSGAHIVSIKCGKFHSGCMSADHQAFLWGFNEDNECCVGDDNRVFTPQCVDDSMLKDSEKGRIVDFFLGNDATMFPLTRTLRCDSTN